MKSAPQATTKSPPTRPGSRTPKVLTWLLAGGLLVAALLIVVLMYGRTVGYTFINYDLRIQLLDNPKVRSLSWDNLVAIFTTLSATSYYPIRLLSFAVDYALYGGYDPRGYHLTNLIIHTINTGLLFLLLGRLLHRHISSPPHQGTGTIRIAPWLIVSIATLLFALHPLVVEPVAWQGAREELLMLMFTLLGVHFHRSARQRLFDADGRPPRRAGAILFYILTALCGAAACTSSALGAAFVLIILAYELAVPRRIRLKPILAGTVQLWLISLATVVVKVMTHREDVRNMVPDLQAGQRFLLVLRSYARNLSHIFWPHDLVLIYPRDVPEGMTVEIIIGALLIVLTLTLLWLLRKRGLALFGLLWMLAAMAPSAQVLPHQHFQADRFLYAPLAGLSIAVASGLLFLISRRSLMYAGLLSAFVVVSMLGYKTSGQLRHWQNNETLWNYCAGVYPNYEFYNNLGVSYAFDKQYEQAVAGFTKALDLVPQDKRHIILLNRASALSNLERYRQAIRDCNEALQLKDDYTQAYAKRAQCYAETDRYHAARRDAQTVLELAPPDSLDADNARRIIEYLDRRGLGR